MTKPSFCALHFFGVILCALLAFACAANKDSGGAPTGPGVDGSTGDAIADSSIGSDTHPSDGAIDAATTDSSSFDIGPSDVPVVLDSTLPDGAKVAYSLDILPADTTVTLPG